jgi:hypothetical protein
MAISEQAIDQAFSEQRPWWTSLFGSSFADKQKLCVTLGKAFGEDKIGDFVTCHLKTILQYYEDVHRQQKASFRTATGIAILGVIVFIITLLSLLKTQSTDFVLVGTIGGGIVEVIAGTVFVIYGRTSRQF